MKHNPFRRSSIGPPVLVFVIVFFLVEFLVRTKTVSKDLVPSPSDVLRVLGVPSQILPRPMDPVLRSPREDARELGRALLDTAASSLAGFGLSAAGGVLIAIILSSARWIRRAFYPYAVFFQTVPVIALAPMMIIWLGIGKPTVIGSAFLVSIFPVIANTLTGLEMTEPALRDLFRLYRAGPFATLFKLRLPSALPNILVGFRIAGGLSIIGAIVGEFIGGGGLGAVIEAARAQLRVEKVFAAVLLASLLGLALLALLRVASALLLSRWERSGE